MGEKIVYAKGISECPTVACAPEREDGMSLETYVSGRITNVFLLLGMPTRIRGYRYLREAVKIVVFDINSLDRMTEDIYKQVARRFGENNEKNVERACSYALCATNDGGRMENLNGLLGVSVYKNRHEKPPVGEFIAMIADMIRLEIMR